MSTVTAATTVAQFVGVADNAAISKLILEGAADGYKAFYAKIADEKDLVTKLEALAATTGNVLDPEAAINTIAAHLNELKKKLKGDVVVDSNFTFARVANQPITNEKRFVMSSIRTWGELRTPRGGGDDYKAVTIDGYYLVDTDQGVEIVSGQILSNTALFKNFVKFDLSKDSESFDLTGQTKSDKILVDGALAFMVRTEEHIANETTYAETREEALKAGKKAGYDTQKNPTTGIESILCKHRVTNKAVFRGLGAKINSVLSAKLEQMALELLEAKSKAQQDAQSKRVDNQLEIEKKAAETKNLNEKVSGLLDTLTQNSDKLQTLGINAQALMLAALTGATSDLK